MIEDYKFGLVKVNGKSYDKDLIIDWKDKIEFWQRKQSHLIDIDAIEKALLKFPEVIIIGTGESGIAQVLDETKEEIQKRGVELIIEETPQAIGTFNTLKDQNKKVVGLFHLTC